MDLTNADWRKSALSGNNGGDCVEVTVLDGHDSPAAHQA
jgi:hypothetical protein